MSNKIKSKRRSLPNNSVVTLAHWHIAAFVVGAIWALYSVSGMLPDHGHCLGYSSSSAWYTHATYIFFHVSIIHLVINSISFFFLWKFIYKSLGPFTFLAFAVAVACSYIAMYDKPTLGISGVVYALTGMVFGLVLIKKIRANRSNILMFSICVVTGLVVSYLKHSSNFTLHFSCLLSGIVLSIGRSIFIKKVSN